jgi:hypothetical protein
MLRIGVSGFAFLMTGMAMARLAGAADWLAVDPQDLEMKSEPNAPGAAAIYLYRQVDRSDANYSEKVYVRIKMITSNRSRP